MLEALKMTMPKSWELLSPFTGEIPDTQQKGLLAPIGKVGQCQHPKGWVNRKKVLPSFLLFYNGLGKRCAGLNELTT